MTILQFLTQRAHARLGFQSCGSSALKFPQLVCLVANLICAGHACTSYCHRGLRLLCVCGQQRLRAAVIASWCCVDGELAPPPGLQRRVGIHREAQHGQRAAHHHPDQAPACIGIPLQRASSRAFPPSFTGGTLADQHAVQQAADAGLAWLAVERDMKGTDENCRGCGNERWRPHLTVKMPPSPRNSADRMTTPTTLIMPVQAMRQLRSSPGGLGYPRWTSVTLLRVLVLLQLLHGYLLTHQHAWHHVSDQPEPRC